MSWSPRALPAAAAVAMTVVSLLSYAPVRLGAIERIADDVGRPQRAVLEAQLERSVVFTQEPFIQYCSSAPARGWVFSRPNNDPGLDNHVLWVNHLSVEKDKLLMRSFPDRAGYLMGGHPSCQVVFIPLADLGPDAVPAAPVSGIEEVGGEETLR